ncbi:hypothetical protein C8R47DRAFT_300656 [Mycena vitilis]|nr:hypothetical protein C8R47DRAFT_300656 [Mycena vitilis]
MDLMPPWTSCSSGWRGERSIASQQSNIQAEGIGMVAVMRRGVAILRRCLGVEMAWTDAVHESISARYILFPSPFRAPRWPGRPASEAGAGVSRTSRAPCRTFVPPPQRIPHGRRAGMPGARRALDVVEQRVPAGIAHRLRSSSTQTAPQQRARRSPREKWKHWHGARFTRVWVAGYSARTAQGRCKDGVRTWTLMERPPTGTLRRVFRELTRPAATSRTRSCHSRVPRSAQGLHVCRNRASLSLARSLAPSLPITPSRTTSPSPPSSPAFSMLFTGISASPASLIGLLCRPPSPPSSSSCICHPHRPSLSSRLLRASSSASSGRYRHGRPPGRHCANLSRVDD